MHFVNFQQFLVAFVKLLASPGVKLESSLTSRVWFALCTKGMNRLVAILLLFLNEEDSFWGLVAIVESLMPAQYYDRTLIAAHADQVYAYWTRVVAWRPFHTVQTDARGRLETVSHRPDGRARSYLNATYVAALVLLVS